MRAKVSTQSQGQLQYQNNIPIPEREVARTATSVQIESGSTSPSGVDYYKNGSSDSNSEEILLHQLEPTHGIVRTTEYTVKYSKR